MQEKFMSQQDMKLCFCPGTAKGLFSTPTFTTVPGFYCMKNFWKTIL